MEAIQQETFSICAETLTGEECSKRFKRPLADREERCLPLIEPGKIVDIGCFTGTFVDVLKQKFPTSDIIGTDYCDDHIKAAKFLYPESANCFSKMSVYDLKFNENSLDCVTLLEVIEHIENVVPAIREINRCLKIGGCLIVTTPNAYSYKRFYSFCREEIKRYIRKTFFNEKFPLQIEGILDSVEWMRHFYCWTPSTLLTLLQANGFEYVTHTYGKGSVSHFSGSPRRFSISKLFLKMFPLLGPQIILKVRKDSQSRKTFI